MVANLPPPVPRKTSSSSAMVFHREGFEVDLFVLGSEYGGESLLRHLNLVEGVETVIL